MQGKKPTQKRHKPIIGHTIGEVELQETEKNPQVNELILCGLNHSPLTNDLKQHHDFLVRAMQSKEYKQDEVIIQEGEKGDCFYVLTSGHCVVKKIIDGVVKQVNECFPGTPFGDLALLFNQPRAASIIATEVSICYFISQEHFKALLMQSRQQQIKYNLEFLQNLEILKPLSDQQKYMVAQALKPLAYPDKTNIITQGDKGDAFYFITKGNVEVIVNENKVAELYQNSFFGEAALLHSAPRNATIRSCGEVDVAMLDVDTFHNLIGQLGSILENGRQ